METKAESKKKKYFSEEDIKEIKEIKKLVDSLIDNIEKQMKNMENMEIINFLRPNMDSVYYMSQYSRPKQWELHHGCIPCAFGCDCCGRIHHRCSSGENMWVYGKKSGYGEAKQMLCDQCYYGKDKHRCPCKMNPGWTPIEVNELTGSRRVRNKCCKCYEYAYPCKGCSLYITDEEREGNETMTYYEFLDRISKRKRKKYPAEYKDFRAQRCHRLPDKGTD